MLASALGMNYCIDQFFPMYSQVNGVLYFVALFFSLFGLLTFLLLNDRKDDSIKYSRMFLVLKGIRLFLSVIAVLIYIAANSSMAVPFTITFVIYYLIYTVFESIILLKNNKKELTK
jgi:uncharacterized membrane protein SirB2